MIHNVNEMDDIHQEDKEEEMKNINEMTDEEFDQISDIELGIDLFNFHHEVNVNQIKDAYMNRMNNEIEKFINSLGKEFPGLSDGFLEQFSEEIGTTLWYKIWDLD